MTVAPASATACLSGIATWVRSSAVAAYSNQRSIVICATVRRPAAYARRSSSLSCASADSTALSTIPAHAAAVRIASPLR